MNQFIPVRDEVIYLGQDDSVANPDNPENPPMGSPVQDVPPFEIKDVPPREPAPWITPQPLQAPPSQSDDFNDGTSDA